MNTDHLWQAFKDGVQIEHKRWGLMTLHRQKLGELILPTGRVIACDPLVFPEMPPFDGAIAPGCYPVIATVASYAVNNDQRIAFAYLLLQEQEPVHWDMATLIGEDVSQLEEGQFFGYPVDAGIGCFMDKDAAAELAHEIDHNWEYVQSLIDDFADQISLNVIVDQLTNMNVIMFASGWGDGSYASYWGYNAEKEKVCLLTDFNLLNDPPPKSSEPSSISWGRLEPLRRFLTCRK